MEGVHGVVRRTCLIVAAPSLFFPTRRGCQARTFNPFSTHTPSLSLPLSPSYLSKIIVHELFDAGLLGEGVLHLLQPIRDTAKRLLPARCVMSLRWIDRCL